MPETMLKRIALTVLPDLHHGITGATESPEAAARRLARTIPVAMRDPTSFMGAISSAERTDQGGPGQGDPCMPGRSTGL